MEDVITSSLQQFQQWGGSPPKPRIPDEDVRKWKPAMVNRCKHGERGPFIVAEEKASPCTSRLPNSIMAQQWTKRKVEDALVSGLAIPLAAVGTEARFRWLADEWSERTMHISSASDLIDDTRYQQIIDLGWDVLPYLLDDLQKNKRFWFPALAAITGVRPFDPGDLSNPRRMTEAWVKWGRRKGLIV